MNTLRNKVQLIGNLGQDPEVVNLETDKKLVKLKTCAKVYFKP